MGNINVLSEKLQSDPLTYSCPSNLIERVSDSINKTQSYYMDKISEDGYWWFELESDVTITAEYLILLHFLGIQDEERVRMVNSIIALSRLGCENSHTSVKKVLEALQGFTINGSRHVSWTIQRSFQQVKNSVRAITLFTV